MNLVGEVSRLSPASVSSVVTLDRIVEKDGVDDRFRQQKIGTELVSGIALSAIGAGGTGYSVVDMVRGSGFAAVLVCAPSLIVLGAGVQGIVESARIWQRFRRSKGEGDGNCSVEQKFYYLAERMSAVGTVVEKKYGMPVEPLSALKDIEHRDYGCGKGYPLRFIDQVTLSSVRSGRFLSCEPDGSPESSPTYVTNYTGSFSLRRIDEEEGFCYRFRGRIPKRFQEFLDLQGSTMALLVSAFEMEEGGDDDAPFNVEWVYVPHP